MFWATPRRFAASTDTQQELPLWWAASGNCSVMDNCELEVPESLVGIE